MRRVSLYLLLFFLLSCSKETTVEGTARQTISARPIPFATLFVEENVGSHTNRISTTTADANGQYKIVFQANRNASYGLDGMASQCDNSVQFIHIANGKSNHIDYQLPAFATLMIHAERHGTDTLWLGRNVLAKDTTFFWHIKGNQPDNFVYELLHNSDYTTNTKTFNVPGLDTLFVQLDY